MSRTLRLIIALPILGAVGWLFVEKFLEVQDSARLASCRVVYIQRVSELYAADNGGLYPPLDSQPGKLIFDVPLLGAYPFSACDLVCESDPVGSAHWEELRDDRSLINDWSYVYLGYILEDDTQALAFAGEYLRAAKESRPLVGDIPVANGLGTCGGNLILALRDVKTLYASGPDCIQSKASTIPVALEWPGHHRRMGGKVVFLDGHEEFVAYPGKFPMTESFIGALRVLDALGKAK